MKIKPVPENQRGGTLMGFIAGLLVGLAVALVVAVYVTKVPVPLLDREAQQVPVPQDGQAEPARSWNPNAGLSPQPATPAGPAQTAGAPPAGALPGPGQTAPATPGADPIGQLIEQRAGALPSAAPPLADPFIYFVQAGAFRNAEDAQEQRARLAMLGFAGKVTELEQAGQTVFRVRVGPFERRVDAEIMGQQMQGQGIETALVHVQR